MPNRSAAFNLMQSRSATTPTTSPGTSSARQDSANAPMFVPDPEISTTMRPFIRRPYRESVRQAFGQSSDRFWVAELDTSVLALEQLERVVDAQLGQLLRNRLCSQVEEPLVGPPCIEIDELHLAQGVLMLRHHADGVP